MREELLGGFGDDEATVAVVGFGCARGAAPLAIRVPAVNPDQLVGVTEGVAAEAVGSPRRRMASAGAALEKQGQSGQQEAAAELGT